MSDATTSPQNEPRPTGEFEQTVKETSSLAKKWLAIAGIIVVSGSAGGVLRNCLGIGAGVVGLQTTAQAAEVQAKNDATHKELNEKIGTMQEQAATAAENSRKLWEGAPDSWRRRSSGR